MALAKRKPLAKTKSKKKVVSKKPLPKKSSIKKKAVAKRKLSKTSSPKKKVVKKVAKLKIIKKAKSKKKEKSLISFSAAQKQNFLSTLSKIIDIHKTDKDGLKSLTRMERILDKYNQQYTDSAGKFDAIVKYGMSENRNALDKNTFVPVQHKEKEVTDIYELLSQIGKGKSHYADALTEIESIYSRSVRARKK